MPFLLPSQQCQSTEGNNSDNMKSIAVNGKSQGSITKHYVPAYPGCLGKEAVKWLLL